MPARLPAARVALVSILTVVGLAGTLHLASAPAAATSQPTGAVRIATVDVLSIVERMILSDALRNPRERFFADTDAPLQALANELRDMQARAQGIAQDSPEFQALSEQFNTRSNEFQIKNREASLAKDRFSTLQVSEAYARVINAAQALAQANGYTHVLASRTGDPTLRSSTVPNAVQEILARPVLIGIPGDDLTERLAKDLGVDQVTIPAAGASPVQPTPVQAQPVQAQPVPVTPAP